MPDAHHDQNYTLGTPPGYPIPSQPADIHRTEQNGVLDDRTAELDSRSDDGITQQFAPGRLSPSRTTL